MELEKGFCCILTKIVKKETSFRFFLYLLTPVNLFYRLYYHLVISSIITYMCVYHLFNPSQLIWVVYLKFYSWISLKWIFISVKIIPSNIWFRYQSRWVSYFDKYLGIFSNFLKIKSRKEISERVRVFAEGVKNMIVCEGLMKILFKMLL